MRISIYVNSHLFVTVIMLDAFFTSASSFSPRILNANVDSSHQFSHEVVDFNGLLLRARAMDGQDFFVEVELLI